MTDTKIDRMKTAGPGRWRRLAPVVAIPLIVLVALIVVMNRDSEVASTEAAVRLPSTGALDPGNYYIPRGSASPGRFYFSVPAGWATIEGFVTKDLEGEPIIENGAGNNVLLVTWLVSHVYADICDWEGTMVDLTASDGFSLPTVDQLANALTTQQGRAASPPTDVMLGGYPAKRIELTVPANLDVAACDGGFIRFWPDPGGVESGGLCCAPAGSTDVVYVVDVDGNTFVVVARHTAESSAEDRAELDAIVESIRIDHPDTNFTSP